MVWDSTKLGVNILLIWSIYEVIQMQVGSRVTKLVSLLLVFLSENYEARHGTCDSCGAVSPDFGKVFKIQSDWICVNCVISRIENKNDWALTVKSK